MARIRHARAAAFAATLALALGACGLDLTNPNAATEDKVVTSAAGARALGIGLQGRLGNSLGEAVWIPGVVAGEFGTTNASLSNNREFQRFPDASANTPRIEPINSDLLNFWSRHYQVVRTADDVLRSVPAVTLAPGTASGLIALAKAMKGYALGTVALSWQQLPVDVSTAQAPFVTRDSALRAAVGLLTAAQAGLSETAVSTEFSSILMAGIDLPNTIRSWQARFLLESGQHAAALTAANAVPATATSEFRYATTDQSPLWAAFTANRYFGAIASYRTGAEAGDTRVARYVGTTTLSAFGGASLNPLAVFAGPAEAYPLISQDELALIRAEAIVRGNLPGDALAQINAVRGRAGLPARTTADLPNATALLAEILRQRQYSLIGTGLRWSDLRRFGQGATARVNFLPYPDAERANNPNTPADP